MTVFSMAWYNKLIQRFFMEYPLVTVFSSNTLSPRGSCAYQENKDLRNQAWRDANLKGNVDIFYV